ncbi:hypothetical protein HDU91_000466 [Kappamyces sp. JEL0680]|nr:hypothetical protein HDU91_000466 [Kappamyces sp. JEL0680]
MFKPPAGTASGFTFGTQATQNQNQTPNPGAGNQGAATAGFGFGAPAANPSTPSLGAAPTFSFAAKPAENTAKPSSFGGFGTGTAASSAPASSTPLFGGLGAAPGPTSSGSTALPGAAAGSAPAAKPLFGGASPAPAAPSLFGGATTASAAPSLFGTPAAAPASTPALNFGAKPSDPSPLSAAKPSTAPAPLFGAAVSNASAANAGTSAPAAGATAPGATTSSAPALSFGAAKPTPASAAPLFGAKPADGAAAAPALSFGAAPATPGPLKVGDLAAPLPAGTAPKAANTPAAAPLAASQPPAVGSISILKNKTLEDMINKWSSELDTYTREFHRQAIQVQKWDHALVSNGALITQLFNELQEVEGYEREIEQNLEYIEAQQAELENSLETFSTQIQSIISQDQSNPNSRFRWVLCGRNIRSTPADEDREKAYTLAEHLNTKLDDMTSSLAVVIGDLNASRQSQSSTLGSGLGEESPLDSITQVLNAHLTSLEWIERSSGKLEGKIEKIRGLEEMAHKNVERVYSSKVYAFHKRGSKIGNAFLVLAIVTTVVRIANLVTVSGICIIGQVIAGTATNVTTCQPATLVKVMGIVVAATNSLDLLLFFTSSAVFVLHIINALRIEKGMALAREMMLHHGGLDFVVMLGLRGYVFSAAIVIAATGTSGNDTLPIYSAAVGATVWTLYTFLIVSYESSQSLISKTKKRIYFPLRGSVGDLLYILAANIDKRHSPIYRLSVFCWLLLLLTILLFIAGFDYLNSPYGTDGQLYNKCITVGNTLLFGVNLILYYVTVERVTAFHKRTSKVGIFYMILAIVTTLVRICNYSIINGVCMFGQVIPGVVADATSCKPVLVIKAGSALTVVLNTFDLVLFITSSIVFILHITRTLDIQMGRELMVELMLQSGGIDYIIMLDVVACAIVIGLSGVVANYSRPVFVGTIAAAVWTLYTFLIVSYDTSKKLITQRGLQTGGKTGEFLTVTDPETNMVQKIPVTNGVVPATAFSKFKILQTTPPPQNEGDTVPIRLYDPGFKTRADTAVCNSSISHIDGAAGKLYYRGYDIEELFVKSSFLEVSYLLIWGHLPNLQELDDWRGNIMRHTFLHSSIEKQMETFRYDAHPM